MLSILKCASLRQKIPTCMKSVLVNSVRNMNLHIKKPRPRIIDILRTKDNIPPNFDLIYRTSAEKFWIYTDYASTIMLVFMGTLSVYVVFSMENLEFPLVDNKREFIIVKQKYQLVLPFLITYCLLIAAKVFSYKFTRRIYFDGDSTYKAVFNGLLPFQKRIMTISKGTVKKAKPSEILSWKHYQYLVNGHKIYLVENDFLSSAELYNFCPEAEYSL
ncbi:uncharacterized protein LOC107265795 [Cephus cinctus]|uniref:Uncharacterized protein LOC107265795 n=1 Tax=Cephus cinctus TaxID=211228 RepID=A0AAJ7BPJ3_CEPCN|nr:uncharacterized protein LOC107265795 [Cephus cinctus]